MLSPPLPESLGVSRNRSAARSGTRIFARHTDDVTDGVDQKRAGVAQNTFVRQAIFTKPTLALAVSRLPIGDAWEYELKLDG